MPRYVINPKSQATIHFAATEAGLGAGTDGSFQITDFKIKHKPQRVSVPATFGASAIEDVGMALYDLDIEFLQDWGVNASSFAKYLYDNEGSTVWFQIQPTGTADTVDDMKGQATIPGVDYGGKAAEPWLCTVSMPCLAKPTRVADT